MRANILLSITESLHMLLLQILMTDACEETDANPTKWWNISSSVAFRSLACYPTLFPFAFYAECYLCLRWLKRRRNCQRKICALPCWFRVLLILLHSFRKRIDSSYAIEISMFSCNLFICVCCWYLSFTSIDFYIKHCNTTFTIFKKINQYITLFTEVNS